MLEITVILASMGFLFGALAGSFVLVVLEYLDW